MAARQRGAHLVVDVGPQVAIHELDAAAVPLDEFAHQRPGELTGRAVARRLAGSANGLSGGILLQELFAPGEPLLQIMVGPPSLSSRCRRAGGARHTRLCPGPVRGGMQGAGKGGRQMDGTLIQLEHGVLRSHLIFRCCHGESGSGADYLGAQVWGSLGRSPGAATGAGRSLTWQRTHALGGRGLSTGCADADRVPIDGRVCPLTGSGASSPPKPTTTCWKSAWCGEQTARNDGRAVWGGTRGKGGAGKGKEAVVGRGSPKRDGWNPDGS